MAAHLESGTIWSPPGVGGQGGHALALVHHARKVGEAKSVALRLLLALRKTHRMSGLRQAQARAGGN